MSRLLKEFKPDKTLRIQAMTLDECERIFDEALASDTEAGFCRAIDPLFDEYGVLSLQIGRGSIFWRARLIEGESYSNVAELDYPPPDFAKRGRLNDHNSPCFYISAGPETAIAEVGAIFGQQVQLAGFRVLEGSPVRLAVFGEYANIQKNGYMRFSGRDPDLTIARALNALPRQEALKKIYIDKFFAHILADSKASENGYIFSRALGQAIYARNSSDGIVYPSVKDYGGFNIAIKAQASDKCFHNVSCEIIDIEAERRFGVIDFKSVKSAQQLDDDGNFVWFQDSNSEIIGIYNMSKEEFDVASRDQDDNNRLLNMTHTHRPLSQED